MATQIANSIIGTRESAKTLPRTIGWQGFTLNVPDSWDLTGCSGTEDAGYLRIDDSAEQGIQIKWATESKKAKAPDISVRRETYFRTLRQDAKKKRLPLATKEENPPRGVQRDGRLVAGFAWSGDGRAVGALWFCPVCRRTVIVQVVVPKDSKLGIGSLADRICGTIQCHDTDVELRLWSLYDLHTRVPKDWVLVGQQLMNVYLRLTFAKGTSRIAVEQWALANVARKEAFLDQWLYANSQADLITKARYTVEETRINGTDAVALSGGLAILALGQPIREITRLQVPATLYSGYGWQSDRENKIYLVHGFTRKKENAVVSQIAEATAREAENWP